MDAASTTTIGGNDSNQGVRNRNKSVHSKNNPTCLENATQYICEFCDKTSMHGFNLLAERGRTIPERIYWIIVIAAATYLSIVLVHKAYKDWLNSPVIVTFATSQLGVWDIPFPALTICPETKSQTSRFNYTDVYLRKENEGALTINETKEFEYMELLCGDIEDLNETAINTDEEAIRFLREVAPSLENVVLYAELLGDVYTDNELKQIFSPVLTSEGVCYTFNNMDRSEIFTDIVAQYGDDFFSSCKPSEWSMGRGFSKDSEIFSSCPKRTLSAGTKGGLNLILATPEFNIDYLCRDSIQGYKVILHHPAEVPRAELGYFFIPLDQAVVAAIKPNVMTTSENLEHYKATDRQCYFSREKGLRFFKIYNQQNCLVECLTNFTLAICGCVEFHMPRENSTPICSALKNKCVEDAKGTFLASEEMHKLNSKEKSQLYTTESCNCLPSCTSLQFGFEYSQADWKWREFIKIQSQTRSWALGDPNVLLENGHLSQLVIFFKDMQFLTSERNELRGTVELWSDFGGLLGLFLGFTFISAFEMLYYLTLRLACNFKLFGRHYWSGSEKLLNAGRRKEETELEDM